MGRWTPADYRYETMKYNRCGRSGLKLPALSLGLWHNFGGDTPHETKRAICRKAFIEPTITGIIGVQVSPTTKPRRFSSLWTKCELSHNCCCK